MSTMTWNTQHDETCPVTEARRDFLRNRKLIALGHGERVAHAIEVEYDNGGDLEVELCTCHPDVPGWMEAH